MSLGAELGATEFVETEEAATAAKEDTLGTKLGTLLGSTQYGEQKSFRIVVSNIDKMIYIHTILKSNRIESTRLDSIRHPS